jgi:hypothetical protein
MKLSLTIQGDLIVVLLGFDAPVVVRSQGNGHYAVIGEAYVHGLMNGEAILGSIPLGWKAQAKRNKQGSLVQIFTQEGSQAEPTYEDPRLGPLPTGWKLTRADTLQDTTFHDESAQHVHKENDPRLLPQALIDRGVKIQTFLLS